MLVVSDTSPLNYLVLIGAIDVLPQLFREVHAPTQVLNELAQSRAPDEVRAWAENPPTWLHVSTPRIEHPLPLRLHPGEAAAITLAEELQASAVLIDERKGRRVAEQLGFEAISTLTVLEFAAERDLLELRPVLDALRQTTFYISDEYIDAALARDAAKRKGK